MLTVASHQGRTIVGRLEWGEDLKEGLRAVCAERQIRGGVITAIGTLETAEVTHYDPEQRAYRQNRSLSGPLELLSLQGNLSESDGELSIHLHATFSREGDNGIEVLGGHLISGQVHSLEFCILALDDVLLRRAQDPDTGLRLWHQGFEQAGVGAGRLVPPSGSSALGEGELEAQPAPVPEPEPSAVPEEPAAGPTPRARRGAARAPAQVAEPPEAAPVAQAEATEPVRSSRTPRVSGPSWDDVAAASAAAPREPAELPVRPDREARAAEEGVVPDEADEEIEDDVDLEPGDIIEHPKFGRCRVERVEGVDEYVHVRLRNRNLVRLSLDVIALELIGSESGHQVFRARIG